MDPQNGNVLAFIGGRDFSVSEFNNAVQAERQVGSAIKPFVYTAALDNGYTPATRVMNHLCKLRYIDCKNRTITILNKPKLKELTA